MKLTIDTDDRTLTVEDKAGTECLELFSKKAFEIISRQWVRVGWNQKYQYTFSWMGRPVIQLPEDMLRMQEVIYNLQPDVIVETGIAHGGSLIFYSSLCRAMNKGRVIGVDIEIRPNNREAIENHELFDKITLIEGSSTDNSVIEQVKSLIEPDDRVLVILDSNHSYEHVLKELEDYADMVSPGSYIVATDGIMFELSDVPRGSRKWLTDNPTQAASDFVKKREDFTIEQPEWNFNESELTDNVTHWPGAWLRRR